MEKFKEKTEKEIKIENSEKEINANFKSKMMFPYGCNRLEHLGFTEADIIELRRIITEEIKRQNELEKCNQIMEQDDKLR